MKSPEERVASIKAKLAEAQRLEQMKQGVEAQNTLENQTERPREKKTTSPWLRLGLGGLATAVAAAFILIIGPKVIAPMDSAMVESSSYAEPMEVGDAPSTEGAQTHEVAAPERAEVSSAIEAEVEETQDAEEAMVDTNESTEDRVSVSGYELTGEDSEVATRDGQAISLRKEMWQAEADTTKVVEFTIAEMALQENPYIEADDEQITMALGGQDLNVFSRDNRLAWVFTRDNNYYYGKAENLSLTELEEFLSDYLDLAD